MDGQVYVLVCVVHVALAGARAGERAVGQRLGRHRGEPVVADRVAGGEGGEHGQRLRGEAAHDVARHRARHYRPLVGGLPADRVGEVGDEAAHRGDGAARRGGGGSPELRVGRLVALAWVGARHEVGVRGGRGDLVDADLVAVAVRAGLGAGQALERLAGRRDVARAGVQVAEHVVERAVLQHQDHDVAHRGEVAVRQSSLAVPPRNAGPGATRPCARRSAPPWRPACPGGTCRGG